MFLKKKKNYKISFELKLLLKVVRLGYIGDNMANAAVLNNDFTIFLNSITVSPFFKSSIAAVLNSGIIGY